MRERIFRVRYCDDKCAYPEMEWCFKVSRYSVSRCVQCEVGEITEDWICDDCGSKFDKFTKYFERCEAPKIEPGQRTVPAIVVIKKLCFNCYNKKLDQIRRN